MREVSKTQRVEDASRIASMRSQGRLSKTHHFADTSQTPRKRLRDHLSLPLSERSSEVALVMPIDDIVEPWLAAELVYPLRDFVSSSIPEAGEEG